MAKIEDISAQSFQFTEVVTPTAPSSGRIKLYAKSDNGLYKQSSDGTETLLVPDTRYKGLRLAKRVIVPEGTPPPIIEIDKYEDGTPLNSTLGGKLVFWSGINTTVDAGKSLLVQLNGISGSEYWLYYGSTNPFTYMSMGSVAPVLTSIVVEIDNIDQNILTRSQYGTRTATGGNQGTTFCGMTTPQAAVTSIKLFLSAGTFPAGTVVEWHERG